MTFEAFIARYGYLALFGGMWVEGETFLVVAGYLSHEGYLRLVLVAGVGFLGAFLVDQAYFYLGRWRGRRLIRRRPLWRLRARRVHAVLRRHEPWVLVGFRFMIGTRIVVPVFLGTAGYSPWRFAVYDGAAAMAWSWVYATAGFAFGRAMGRLLAEAAGYQWAGVGLLSLLGVGVWVARLLWLRRRPAG